MKDQLRPKRTYSVREADEQGLSIGIRINAPDYPTALKIASGLTFWRLFRDGTKFPINDCLPEIT